MTRTVPGAKGVISCRTSACRGAGAGATASSSCAWANAGVRANAKQLHATVRKASERMGIDRGQARGTACIVRRHGEATGSNLVHAAPIGEKTLRFVRPPPHSLRPHPTSVGWALTPVGQTPVGQDFRKRH